MKTTAPAPHLKCVAMNVLENSDVFHFDDGSVWVRRDKDGSWNCAWQPAPTTEESSVAPDDCEEQAQKRRFQRICELAIELAKPGQSFMELLGSCTRNIKKPLSLMTDKQLIAAMEAWGK